MKIIHSLIKSKPRLDHIQKSRGYTYIWWNKRKKVQFNYPHGYHIWVNYNGDVNIGRAYVNDKKSLVHKELQIFARLFRQEQGIRKVDLSHDWVIQKQFYSRLKQLKHGVSPW